MCRTEKFKSFYSFSDIYVKNNLARRLTSITCPFQTQMRLDGIWKLVVACLGPGTRENIELRKTVYKGGAFVFDASGALGFEFPDCIQPNACIKVLRMRGPPHSRSQWHL